MVYFKIPLKLEIEEQTHQIKMLNYYLVAQLKLLTTYQ